jgi:hypothetical protein
MAVTDIVKAIVVAVITKVTTAYYIRNNDGFIHTLHVAMAMDVDVVHSYNNLLIVTSV